MRLAFFAIAWVSGAGGWRARGVRMQGRKKGRAGDGREGVARKAAGMPDSAKVFSTSFHIARDTPRDANLGIAGPEKQGGCRINKIKNRTQPLQYKTLGKKIR